MKRAWVRKKRGDIRHSFPYSYPHLLAFTHNDFLTEVPGVKAHCKEPQGLRRCGLIKYSRNTFNKTALTQLAF